MVASLSSSHPACDHQNPSYGVCAQEFAWAGILSQLYNLGLRGDEKLLLSVYNPNRLGFAVSAAAATFKSRGAVVGSFAFEGPSLELAPGAITDVLATVRFEPTLWQAYHLYWDFELGSLTFAIDASFTGDVMLGRAKLYTLSSDVAEHSHRSGASVHCALVALPARWRCGEHWTTSEQLLPRIWE